MAKEGLKLLIDGLTGPLRDGPRRPGEGGAVLKRAPLRRNRESANIEMRSLIPRCTKRRRYLTGLGRRSQKRRRWGVAWETWPKPVSTA